MTTILAAIDASATARPVLDAGAEVARLAGAELVGVHVLQEGADLPQAVADRKGIRLRILPGPVDQALLATLAEPGVVAAVIGARGSRLGRRPLGGTALRLVHAAGKPVVVVPPEADEARPIRRVVVPLEGDEASSRVVLGALNALLSEPVEPIVVHVFTDDTLPRMLDRPVRDLKMIGTEFLARHLPTAERMEFRTGAVDQRIVELCDEETADLIVLSWSQHPGPGRAPVVRGVLSTCPVPVLLLPVTLGPGPGVDGEL